jgi:hypothetical protein
MHLLTTNDRNKIANEYGLEKRLRRHLIKGNGETYSER